ncbi:hypothetical protein [uncultured Zoogloea sp.]|uniref:hypothetical protein n=1 Tax=uncultured Zoogloea sp. TaxID=160237 RepID=UPI0026218D76|nr:hypothetical protein [uncultured Zoogloea sp.]
MKTYHVAGPDLLEPFWFNKVRHGQHAAVVAEDGTVTLEGVALRVRDEAPAPGTAVQVWLNGSGFFVCATLEEIEREAQARRNAEAAEAERRRQKLNAMRADAEAFNARIALPVKWDVGIKDVLSGLSENSWGDGRSKATVEHIYLLEPLEAGRLTRKEGDFLCTSASGTNGKRWSSKIVERCHDGEGTPYQPKVTCKACLALAQRWMKESS